MGGARPTTKKSLVQPKKIVPKILAQTAKPEVIHKTPVPQAVYDSVGVQMLSSKLHSQLFPGGRLSQPSSKAIKISQRHLKAHDLNTELASRLPETSFDLPPLRGNSIDEHFYNIGAHMAMPWLEIAMNFAESKERGLPPRPEKFQHYPGWTRYNADGSFDRVEDLGSESAICFDVETLPEYSPFPVMACAISETARYVWISPWLLGLDSSPEHLIPIGDPSLPRVIVGHHVSYDRARILEEYSMEGTKNRFLDTMSLHIACKGITSGQRPAWLLYRKQKREAYERQLKEIEEIRALLADIESQPELDRERHDNLLAVKADLEGSLPTLVHTPDEITGDDSDAKRWEEVTSVNSLADLARLYCGIDLDKSTRDDFMTSTREGIAANIDKYLQYCCSDVETTLSIYQIVLPAFLRSCPNPVSAAGIFTMGSAFLTVDQEWNNYINSAEQKYHELEDGVRGTLLALAKDAFAMYDSDVEGKKPWESDEWLSQLDWTPKKVGVSRGIEAPERPPPETRPKWFADITKEKLGPTVQDRVIPLLLNMKWKPDPSSKKKTTYPLFFSSKHGWLVGSAKKNQSGLGSTVEVDENDELAPFRGTFQFFLIQADAPVRKVLSRKNGGNWIEEGHIVCDDDDLTNMALRFCSGTAPDSDWDALRSIANSVLDDGPPSPKDIKKFPSKHQLNWKGVQVGKRPSRNPADIVYWPKWYWDLTAPRTDAERGTPNLTVRSQIAPLLLRLRWMDYPLFHSRTHGWTYRVPKQDLEKISTTSKPLEFIDETDSKLKKMCEDEHFSCDVDRQAKINMGLPAPPPPSPPPGTPDAEAGSVRPRKYGMILPQVITMGTVTRRAIEKTWLTASNAKANRIGSELKTLVRAPEGYAIFGIHGATAIGWMTLEGTKAAGTDLHSKTASILGISRNQAKCSIIHAFTEQESTTRFGTVGQKSYLFNKLEQIATSDNPRTPALGCGVTSALSKKYLPKNSGEDYMTSRINWVVQSSGVDYLHMLIVAIDYLIQTYGIKARYLISIHDEVRYLAEEGDKYRLALALQIANLWTRSMFAYKLGFDNLPQGVAFFSAVDVDKYLRKEVDMTCVTPSQPYPLPPGESLNIHQILEKTSGGSLHPDGTTSRVGCEPELKTPPKPYAAPDVLAHREAYEEFLEAQSLKDTYDIRTLAQVVRSREREREAELEAHANTRPKLAIPKASARQAQESLLGWIA
ncbi:DNA polymerase A domain [Rhizoctonia solani]|uniref:Mitochondrial DNA polymerase catalytic subunit n=1 Tax=Rhizoctonia solani TaxID=456999 RepID=A0A8H7M670_9AGAM|nr:DNA polymerase A domain [Rhizoctonia solani]